MILAKVFLWKLFWKMFFCGRVVVRRQKKILVKFHTDAPRVITGIDTVAILLVCAFWSVFIPNGRSKIQCDWNQILILCQYFYCILIRINYWRTRPGDKQKIPRSTYLIKTSTQYVRLNICLLWKELEFWSPLFWPKCVYL